MPDTEPKEVELKLAASGEAMDTLLASQLLRAHARSPVRTRQLVTTYYDTDDHRLGRRRLALRVRQSGRRFVQTLKSANKSAGAETSHSPREVSAPALWLADFKVWTKRRPDCRTRSARRRRPRRWSSVS